MTPPPDNELDEVVAERDALAAEVAALQRKVDRRATVRSVGSTVLVILTCLSLLAATLAVWTGRSLTKTDIWVERVGPVADNAAVQELLTTKITDEIMKIVDPKALFEDALPDKGQLLAIPLTSAVEGFVHDQVASYISSDQFAELWVKINEKAHAAAVKVLEGDSEVVQAGDGKVTLDLLPIINAVLARIGELSPEVFGRTVDVPTITVDELPEDSIKALADRFGVDLPGNYGQITIYDDGKLAEAQAALSLFKKVEALLVVLTLVLAPIAIWMSPRRRRTVLQLSVGGALAIVLARRLVLGAAGMVVGEVKGETQKDAAQFILDQFTDPLLAATQWMLIAALVIAVIAAVSGPYGWAVALRAGAVRGGVAFGRAVRVGAGRADELARDDATAAWMLEHKGALQAGGFLVAVLLLWVFDLSWLGTLVLLGLLAAYELGVSRLGSGGEDEEEVPPPGPMAVAG